MPASLEKITVMQTIKSVQYVQNEIVVHKLLSTSMASRMMSTTINSMNDEPNDFYACLLSNNSLESYQNNVLAAFTNLLAAVSINRTMVCWFN